MMYQTIFYLFRRDFEIFDFQIERSLCNNNYNTILYYLSFFVAWAQANVIIACDRAFITDLLLSQLLLFFVLFITPSTTYFLRRGQVLHVILGLWIESG